MRLPRDVSGHELARAFGKFGYAISRQTGNHMRLTSKVKGVEHHIAIPAHDPIRVGTLSQILGDVSAYLEIPRDELSESLFG